MSGVPLVKLPSDKFHWTLLIIGQHHFRQWLGAGMANLYDKFIKHNENEWFKNRTDTAQLTVIHEALPWVKSNLFYLFHTLSIYNDDLVQDYRISIANALEILQTGFLSQSARNAESVSLSWRLHDDILNYVSCMSLLSANQSWLRSLQLP